MRTYNLIIFSFFLFSLGCEKEKHCSQVVADFNYAMMEYAIVDQINFKVGN
ncbi:MAG: hypothetical protein IPO94_14900 [Saprospiraceae bacterium]|nr:hypothetical protein [Saprospiraceae bacterium]